MTNIVEAKILHCRTCLPLW